MLFSKVQDSKSQVLVTLFASGDIEFKMWDLLLKKIILL